MSRILVISIFFLSVVIFPLGFSHTAYAIELKDPRLELIQSPDPVSIDTLSTLSITVKTKDDSDYFIEKEKGGRYSFVAWIGELNRAATCTSFNFRGITSDELKWDTRQITAKPKNNCAAIGNEIHFRLWRGDGWDTMQNQDNIIVEYSFIIAQTGGQTVTITAKADGEVYKDEQPTVILSNVVPNADYTFWWDGDVKDIAGYYSRDKDLNNPLEVKIPYFNYNKQDNKLCMEYGWHRFPPAGNNSCNIFGKNAMFHFINKKRPAPSGPVKCTILPSASIQINSEANLLIKNLPAGTDILANVLEETSQKIVAGPIRGTSDATNAVTLNLLSQATIGSYYVTAIYNSNGQDVCKPPITFSVGKNFPLPSAKICTEQDIKDGKCSSGGGQIIRGCNDPEDPNYDPKNPAIATAIGCIHTNPAELVKDVMKFVLGIGGGIAFLMMLLGAFQMLTSAGNPETLNAGKERLTSAVIGLLFVIFAVLLLQIIGWDILKIPGFGP